MRCLTAATDGNSKNAQPCTYTGEMGSRAQQELDKANVCSATEVIMWWTLAVKESGGESKCAGLSKNGETLIIGWGMIVFD